MVSGQQSRRKRQMAVYRERVSKGLCYVGACKRKPEPNRRTCEYHLRKSRKRQKLRCTK